jgi:hypothetical protein
MTMPLMKGKLVRDRRASKDVLLRVVANDVAASQLPTGAEMTHATS